MKIVIQVWTQNCSNLKKANNHFWGLGDLIRGTIKLFQLSRTMNFNLIVNINLHPVSNFLKHRKSQYDDVIEKNKNDIKFILPDNVETHITTSNDEILFFLTNDFCDEKNITDECKQFIKDILEPNDELSKLVNSYTMIGNNFEILHFRLGDNFLVDNQAFMSIKTITDLERKIKQHYTYPNIFMCDSVKFKSILKGKNKNILMFDLNIGHIGYDENLDKIRNSLLEFFIVTRSTKIKTFSVYAWISGFVYWISKIYDIPLVKL